MLGCDILGSLPRTKFSMLGRIAMTKDGINPSSRLPSPRKSEVPRQLQDDMDREHHSVT